MKMVYIFHHYADILHVTNNTLTFTQVPLLTTCQTFCNTVTFLNIMSDPTDSAVNRAAISNMMIPTGMLVFRPVSAAIQPLAKQKQRQL